MEAVGLEEAKLLHPSAAIIPLLHGGASGSSETADLTAPANMTSLFSKATTPITAQMVPENKEEDQHQSRGTASPLNDGAASSPTNKSDSIQHETVPQVYRQSSGHAYLGADALNGSAAPNSVDFLEQPEEQQQPQQSAILLNASDASPTGDRFERTPHTYQESSEHVYNGDDKAAASPSDIANQSDASMDEDVGTFHDQHRDVEGSGSLVASHQGHMMNDEDEPLQISAGEPDGYHDIFGSSDFASSNMGQDLLEVMSNESGEHPQTGQSAHSDLMDETTRAARIMNGAANHSSSPGADMALNEGHHTTHPEQLTSEANNRNDSAKASDDVIELLDDEEENALYLPSKKRKWSLSVEDESAISAGAAAQASAMSRIQHMPSWMRDSSSFHLQQTSQLPAPRAYPSYAHNIARLPQTAVSSMLYHQPSHAYESMLLPVDVPMKPGYLSTWKKLLPRGFLAARKQKEEMATQRKAYALSVLNVSEFTISGVSPDGYSDPSSVQGLRSRIRQFSRDYGKAVFERDSESIDGGKWRIPLGAYQAFYTYLTSLPRTVVQGISERHLNIAMLGRQRLEKGFPSVEKLIHMGVPIRMANTLAPFQRGGVDFVHERNGRALIADDMGLGKTIQAIASMAIYHKEWPVLVLSPSGARYHWQNEFLNWLGEENIEQKQLDFGNEGEAESQEEGLPHDYEDFKGEQKPPMPPLLESQVHVLTSGNDPILPSPDTKVVIVSYGLAPKLALEGKMLPGLFKCAIVDESHMLKNKNSKRTKGLVPVLSATKRCILLSGTPAFARPIELWPQVQILGTCEDRSLSSEEEFVRKYVKGRSKSRLAELHTLLIGTLMIRRMKTDILKQLPSKVREQALVNVLDNESREEFKGYLEALRRGKGALASIARTHKATVKDEEIEQDVASTTKLAVTRVRSNGELKKQVEQEIQNQFNEKTGEIDKFYANQLQMNPQDDPKINRMAKLQALNALRADFGKFYHKRLSELKKANVLAGTKPSAQDNDSDADSNPEPPTSRKAALIQMYKKTGQVKIPLVADMLKLWLANPTKGKLCIFAHHISVLNEIGSRAGLSNAEGSTSKFIRIDGSTNPKQRQQQINSFQKDPSIRIALLGITAAGVAVTLTAASTVWFAELFWTPALLVQAEDRCHRIGQQARVRCLYVVAKGTLDEILWKHVEKKFRDLGEFVEGKEKMKLVVHKRYKGSVDLRKSLQADKDEDFEEEYDEDVDAMESAEQLENELHDDIEELEREEQEMLKVDATSDDDEDVEGKSAASGPQTVAGTTETEAICLSDDEEEGEAAPPIIRSLRDAGVKNDREFPAMKMYKMRFPAPSCGIEIVLFKGRVVVKGKSPKIHRPESKPHVGDILISCNNEEVVPNVKLKALMQHFQDILVNEGSIEFIFGEDQEFTEYFKSNLTSPNFSLAAYMEGEGGNSGSKNDFLAKLPNLPRYDLTFQGDHDLGFGIGSVNSVIIVTTIHPSRLQTLGPEAQPQVGDAIVAINRTALRPGLSTNSVKKMLKSLKAKGVEITFATADESMKASLAARIQQLKAQSLPAPSRQSPIPPPHQEPEVIDLLD